METGLSEQSLRAIANVLYSNARVQSAKIFGSRAIGTFHEGSDIDICLFGEELTISDLNRISSDLDDLNIPEIVDLVNFRTIKNENLLKHIADFSVQIEPAPSALVR
ncbi:MAG: nucleotidyltransferase family protein [Bacteroidota bacterium]|jgi:predicted nucleotidyltransferase